MPSEEDNTRLMWAILSQRAEKGKLTGVDWAKVAEDLGINKPHTAYCRWDSLYKVLRARGLPGIPSGGGTAATKAMTPQTTPKKLKTANPKARSAITKPRGAGKGEKTAKLVEEETEDEEDKGKKSPSKVETATTGGVTEHYEGNSQHEFDSIHEDTFYDAL